MKVFAVGVCAGEETQELLASELELSHFGFFERMGVKEFLPFFIRTIAERTDIGQRQSVEQDNFVAHAYRRFDGISGVMIVDREYPPRVAYSLLNKMLDEFAQQVPQSNRQPGLVWPSLKNYLTRYQDPRQADTIIKVQQELDDTKIVLHKTIESVLQRGEKLDSLVEKSDMLSSQSKVFYKSAKKQNSCCSLM
ncbi:Longin-like domain-containing protein [Syncephalis plumigaleata]|nr:Longin-like domain-containing protein [Syncephalis plumigaleata]